ncbi:hypothetical protein [uncultured Sphingomonas sp.]|uniref:hypothetical protein n=1 Tax=uncultured Sphingomonas sp. TaxID=158754 RepID=UPI0035CAE1CD
MDGIVASDWPTLLMIVGGLVAVGLLILRTPLFRDRDIAPLTVFGYFAIIDATERKWWTAALLAVAVLIFGCRLFLRRRSAPDRSDFTTPAPRPAPRV